MGGGGGVGLVIGCQGGCERRIEVFVKIKKKNGGSGGCRGGGGREGGVGSGLGGQGGCERRIENFGKLHNKKLGGGVSGVGRGSGGGRVGGGGRQGGCERNVWGRGWYGVCEPRIEGIVQCTKRYCTILRKLKKNVCVGGGGGGGQYLNPKHSLCI